MEATITVITRRDYLVNSHGGLALAYCCPSHTPVIFFFFFCTQVVSLSALWKGRSLRLVTPKTTSEIKIWDQIAWLKSPLLLRVVARLLQSYITLRATWNHSFCKTAHTFLFPCSHVELNALSRYSSYFLKYHSHLKNVSERKQEHIDIVIKWPKILESFISYLWVKTKIYFLERIHRVSLTLKGNISSKIFTC